MNGPLAGACLIAMLVGLAALAVHLLWLGRQTCAGPGRVPPTPDAHRPFLYWRFFYLNPDDPRGWLPKLSGLGYTVNFRAPVHVHVFVALMLLILGSALGMTAAVLPG